MRKSALASARTLGTPLALAALLHDVGKVSLPTEIIQKLGPLTPSEKQAMRHHPILGEQFFEGLEHLEPIRPIIRSHHERFDGSGYPKGWKGNQIPVFGRIGGIVDSYAAITSDRPYAKAKSSYDAMRELKALSDKHFQAEMVEQFIRAVGIFPAGTLVELNTGEIGVVLKENQSSRLQPELAIILDSDKQPSEEVKSLDLRQEGEPTPIFWIERGIEPGAYGIDPREYFL